MAALADSPSTPFHAVVMWCEKHPLDFKMGRTSFWNDVGEGGIVVKSNDGLARSASARSLSGGKGGRAMSPGSNDAAISDETSGAPPLPPPPLPPVPG